MVGPYEAVTGIYGGPLYNGQNVPLHAFPAHVGPVPALPASDFVNLVEKNDAACLHTLERNPGYLIHIDQLLLFFLHQVIEGFTYAHIPAPAALPEDIGQHVFEIDAHLLDTAGGCDLKRGPALFHFKLDNAVV